MNGSDNSEGMKNDFLKISLKNAVQNYTVLWIAVVLRNELYFDEMLLREKFWIGCKVYLKS